MIAFIIWAIEAALICAYILTPRRPAANDQPHGSAYYARARYLRERGEP